MKKLVYLILMLLGVLPTAQASSLSDLNSARL